MIFRRLLAIAAFAALAGCASNGERSMAGRPPAHTDISQAFVDFYDRTQGMEEDARLAAFKAEVAPLFPGFYMPRQGRTQEQWDRQVKAQLAGFPAIRDRYVAVQRDFGEAFAEARRRFTRTFPNSRASLPTWLLHSLGEMDGGTREIDGHVVLIFGADGIARYHTPSDIGPFFDHELFHVEHGRYFPDCEPVWCSLWIEGLATAAAEQMNPGVDAKGLMLETPKPIAPTVDANWPQALCTITRLADSTAPDEYRLLFYASGGNATFAPRWGYYVGWKLARRVLQSHKLVDLAHLPSRQVEPLVKSTLAAMVREAGGCAQSL